MTTATHTELQGSTRERGGPEPGALARERSTARRRAGASPDEPEARAAFAAAHPEAVKDREQRLEHLTPSQLELVPDEDEAEDGEAPEPDEGEDEGER